MAGNLRGLNTRSADLLPPRDIGAPEGVRTETGEIASLGSRRPLQSLAYAGIPQREAAAVRPDEDTVLRLRLSAAALTR